MDCDWCHLLFLAVLVVNYLGEVWALICFVESGSLPFAVYRFPFGIGAGPPVCQFSGLSPLARSTSLMLRGRLLPSPMVSRSRRAGIGRSGQARRISSRR